MNLEEARKRVEYELRHAPGVQAHRDEIAARLNTALEKLVLGHNWSFRERAVQVVLHASTTFASGAYTANPSVTLPSETTVTGNVSRGFTFTTPSAWNETRDLPHLAGQICEISGSTTASANGRWVIEHAFASPAGTTCIILDPRYPGHTALGGTPSLEIKWVRYHLPEDCATVDALFLRGSKQPLPEIPRSRERDMYLSEDDDAGTPRFFVVEPSLVDAFAFTQTTHWPHVELQGPVEAPTLTSNNSGGSLTSSATYQYRYTWRGGGLTSAPSPITEITLGASDNRVVIANLEVQGAALNPLGRFKVIERRQKFANHEGPWVAATTMHSYASTGNDIGTTLWPGANPAATQRTRHISDFGSAKHIRVWPLPSEDVTAELHYFSRAPKLEAGSDVPQLPVELHMALVYDVCLDLAATQDGSAGLIKHFTARRQELIDVARRTYQGNRGVRAQLRGVLEGDGGWEPRVQPLGYTS